MYSVIQTIGLEIIFAENNEYTDFLYIYMDFVIALNLANCIGLLAPITTLKKALPHYTLLYPKFIVSLAINFVLTFACMIFGLWMVKFDKGYFSENQASIFISHAEIKEKRASFESTVISLLAI